MQRLKKVKNKRIYSLLSIMHIIPFPDSEIWMITSQFTCDSFQIHKGQLQEHKMNLLGHHAHIRGKLQHATEEPLLLFVRNWEKRHLSCFSVKSSATKSKRGKFIQQNTFQKVQEKNVIVYFTPLNS